MPQGHAFAFLHYIPDSGAKPPLGLLGSFSFHLSRSRQGLGLLHAVHWTGRRVSDKSVQVIGPELRVLVELMRVLGQLFDLAEVELVVLELGQVVDAARVFWGDVVDLGEVLLLDDGEVDLWSNVSKGALLRA